MAYRFKRKESVSKAVPRLGCERIEDALTCLAQSHRANAIHGARKNIKKVRAIVRLVRDQVAKKEFCRLTDALRDAASQLAAPRDAYVKTQTLRQLARDFRGRVPSAAVHHIRAILRGDLRKAMERFAATHGPRAVESALYRAATALQCLELEARGWRAIGPGVKAAYREGRRACRTARAAPTPGNFHAWRKHAKDLWCYVRLLQRLRPGQMEAMAGELDTLGEWLGDDHDLAVLREDLDGGRFGDGNARGVKVLTTAVAQRQRKLRRAALALGARFYAEKPSVFCERLADDWNTWRSGNQ